MQTPEHSLLRDIQETNLSYLMLAQRILRDDRAIGMARLGIDEDVATLLLQLSPAQMVRLASVNSVICGFRLNDFDILSALSRDIMGGVLQQAHTTILLMQNALPEEGGPEQPLALDPAT